MLPVRDVSLFTDVVGHGYPLVLMHGGPSADLWTLSAFRRLADQFTLIFYDHRCNGRSTGTVTSMTWDNLTADADALRAELGFERWAVLGHSFGGHVALEYALRFPDRLSHLVLLDTGGDSWWARENASRVVAERGYGLGQAALVHRWFHGEFEPEEYRRIFLRIGQAYNYRPLLSVARLLAHGAWRSKARPDALIFAGRHLLDGWTVMDRLGDITAPTLVIAGRDDFVFPPACQHELCAAIPGAQLRIVDRAGHNPHDEQSIEVMAAIRRFITTGPTA
jgi:pimeloyl-ACP methyl ester carboxylesterase